MSEAKKSNDPLRDGALAALAVAEAVGQTTMDLAGDPGVRAGAAVAAAIARIVAGILERHGAAGAAEARALLERLLEEGPQAITDAELEADDEALFARIEGWYGEEREGS